MPVFKKELSGARAIVAANDAPSNIKVRADYVCDGVDDDIQIQAALAKYGSIELSKGTFYIGSTITLETDYSVVGQGMGGTTLYAKNNLNTHIFSSNASSLVFFVHLSNFRIDGNKTNQSSGTSYGINMKYAHSWTIENLHIKDTKNQGIDMSGDASRIALNNKIFKNRIENTGAQCLFISSYAPNNHIVGNIIGGNDDWYGIECGNDENIFVDNHVHSTSNSGIYVTGTNNLFSGCIVESSTGNHGWDIAGNHNRFVGCIGFNNNSDGFNVNSSYNSFVACRAFDRQGTKTQDYGFDVQSGANYNIFSSCVSLDTDHNLGGFRDNGTGNLFSNNQGYDANNYQNITLFTTGPQTLNSTNSIILCDTTSAGFTLNLPTAASFKNRIFQIKKIDSGSNTVTIDADGAETIDGQATQQINTPYVSISLISNGTSWFII